MTYSINKNKIVGSIALALALVFVVAATPATTHANVVISTGAGSGTSSNTNTLTINRNNPITIDYTVNKTNSGNISLTINKPVTVTRTSPINVTINKTAATPVLAYDYGSYGYNSYGCDTCGYSYPTYYPPVVYPPSYTPPPTYSTSYAPLYISCYSQPLSTSVGSTVVWTSSVSGGTGSYSYSWTSSNGFLGNSSSVSTVYYSAGTYSAYLTVTSNGQTQSVNCSNSVTVYGNNYYNNSGYYNNNYNNYSYNNNYSQIQVSCVSNVSNAYVGSPVTWSASVNGANGGYYNYSYSWSGTDGVYGYNQSISTTYNTPGYKTASVTVTANGQTVTQTCTNSINITGYQNQNVYYTGGSNNNNGLDIGCYADPATASINQPVTWAVEVTGGNAPYTYSWSGSDGLTGSASTLIKYYNTLGSKNAVVSVTSADGKTGTRACSNDVAVRGAGGNGGSNGSINNGGQNGNQNAATSTNANQSNNGQSAAALFSLQNVPWGWIAILIILVLFATILYLVFNRPKI